MTPEDQRRLAICEACPEFRRHGTRYWCERFDDNRTRWHNCPRSKHGRCQGRLTLPSASCERWNPPAPDPFDRAVIINLDSRPDLSAAWKSEPWPFKQPDVFSAIDGQQHPEGRAWGAGSGAWGCRKSHLRVLSQALSDHVGRLLILEGDATLAPDFGERIKTFLAAVPADWDCLMLGGQHRHGRPDPVAPGVVRCRNCQRTHAYLIRGTCLKSLYNLWARMTTGHIDHLAGEWQPAWKVYAPEPFLIGQRAARSDITHRPEGTRFWSDTRIRHKHIRLSVIRHAQTQAAEQ